MFGLYPTDESAPTEGRAQQIGYLCNARKWGNTFPTITYGHRQHADKARRIQRWLEEQPFDWDFVPACTADVPPMKLFIDWLHWLHTDALTWLRKLDAGEKVFRIVGLRYHKIPYELRHSTFMLPGSRIDQLVLTRLSNVLETDTPRRLQTYFTPWIEIYNTVIEVLDQLNAFNLLETNNIELVRSAVAEAEAKLSTLATPWRALKAGLEWLETSVAELNRRSSADGGEALAAKFSWEGNLFRRWIQTFLRIGEGNLLSKQLLIEEYVQGVLRRGVVSANYWSGRAQ
ncbi:hypothetical protein NX059_005877 [Plenodomus lindquistii]|nr:hypothetical protein NX059_005877 [Plenodomus lindquistii]